MNTAIFFDTETTGLPDWKAPSESEAQPHIVQLAAHVLNLDSKKIIHSMDVIIKPDGWVIPEEVSTIHGITTEYALQVGIPEKQAVEMFLALWGGRLRVAFNTTFDNRIIRVATKRFCSEEVINAWHEGEYECAMIASRKVIGGKNPALEDAYKNFTGKELIDAHTAIADVNACIEVYFAAKQALLSAA